jgi:hypothetical protein
MPTMTCNLDVTEEQSLLIAKTLCLPFEYGSVFCIADYECHKGWRGSYEEPPEPEEVEINNCYISELYDTNGNVCNLTYSESVLLNNVIEWIVNPLELETKCFEHHEAEEDDFIMQRSIAYYEEYNLGATNYYLKNKNTKNVQDFS